MTTVGQLQAEIERLRPHHVLWNEQLFQNWVAELEEEMAAISEAGIAIPIGVGANAAQAKLLARIGMEAPKTHEESLRVYLCLRAVVHFVRRKLGQMKSESERFKKLERQLHESTSGTANDVTRRGSGVGRFQ